MSDETCGVSDGGKACDQPAAALVSQTTRESKGQREKEINTYMCEKHAKQIEATSGPHTVTWL